MRRLLCVGVSCFAVIGSGCDDASIHAGSSFGGSATSARAQALPRKREAEAIEALTSRLREDFPAHAAHLIDGARRFVPTSDGFEAAFARHASTWDDAMVVTLPSTEGEPIAMRVGDFSFEVEQLGLVGSGAAEGSAVIYPRRGGASLWVVGADGVEEWLMFDAGTVAGDGPLAAWRVADASLRLAGDWVEVLDAAGVARVRVQAPRAFTPEGREVDVRLGIDGDRLVLHARGDGEALLVDPLWTPTSVMATARYSHSATLLQDGRVLVAGGRSASNGYLATAELFDPTTETWSAAGAMPDARSSAPAVLLLDGRVLVAGGDSVQFPLATSTLYDPSTNSWSAGPQLAHRRGGPTGSILLDGRVLVTGGLDDSTRLASCEFYDPATNSWSAAPSMAWGRSGHTASRLLDGQVLVAHGTGVTQQTELYLPWSNIWVNAGLVSAERSGHRATVMSNGLEVIVTGGFTSNDPDAGRRAEGWWSLNWDTLTSFQGPRAVHSATLLPNNRILVAGGITPGFIGTVVDTVRIYDPDDGTWLAGPPLPGPRYRHTATLLANRKVLLAGGRDQTTTLATAVLYSHGIQGDPCSSGLDCLNDLCVDGACCDNACGGGDPTDCLACSVAGGAPTDGTCATVVPDGHICRPTNGGCDVAESCDGVFTECPLDTFVAPGTSCRASVDVCDVTETCTGVGPSCPVDAFVPSTVICREPNAGCDAPEYCTGFSAPCPNDRRLLPGEVCRPVAGPCDHAETCSGASDECPPDTFVPFGSFVACRPAAGVCDSTEMCDGTSAACPFDAFISAGEMLTCRFATDVCDAAERCDGTSPDCPADGFVPANSTVCRIAVDRCDAAEMCDGMGQCAPDIVHAAGHVCRAAAHDCDVEDLCDGIATACADIGKPADSSCGPSSLLGACDVQDTCTGGPGNQNVCTDWIFTNAVPCREAAPGSCDATENCTGASHDCPADAAAPDGVACGDDGVCRNGACSEATATSSSATSGSSTATNGPSTSSAGGGGDGGQSSATSGAGGSDSSTSSGVATGGNDDGAGGRDGDESTSSGCGCRIAEPDMKEQRWMLALLAVAAVAVRRRVRSPRNTQHTVVRPCDRRHRVHGLVRPLQKPSADLR